MRLRSLAGSLLVAAALGWAGTAHSASPCLNPSVEIHCDHDEIVQEAGKLATPLAMYKFVHDTIEYEVYYGSRKGALGTLRSGRGNDYDQASLLIALLRAAGYEARYGIGVTNVDAGQLTAWTGIRDGNSLEKFFKTLHCGNLAAPYGPCTESPSHPSRFTVTPNDLGSWGIFMERAWVEARLPAHYRGVAVDGSPPTWIPLDPSWKQKAYPAVLPDPPLPLGDEITGDCASKICFSYTDYWSKVDPRLLSEVWERQLQKWLAQHRQGESLDDYVHDGPIIPYAGEVLPASLPYFPEPQHAAENGIPATPPVMHTADLGTLSDGVDRRARVRVQMRNGNGGGLLDFGPSPAIFYAAEIVDKRVTVSFEPTTATRPQVLKNGGYLGGWTESSNYASLLERCINDNSQRDNYCGTEVVVRLEGVEKGRLTTPGKYLGQPYNANGWQLHLEVDRVPGSPTLFDRPIIVGEFVALAVDLQAAGSQSIRDRLGEFLHARNDIKLVDETLVAQGDSDDPNQNNIPGEILIDQGTVGTIEPCPSFTAANAMTTCDIAVSAQFAASDALIGELLHLAALRYYQRAREETRRLAQLDQLVVEQLPPIGVTRAGVQFTYLFDQPVGVEPAAPVIDVPGFSDVASTIDYDPNDPDLSKRGYRYGRRMIHVRSALEHQVWEELIGSEFISTVKGIQLVRERFPGKPVQIWTTGNWPVYSELNSFEFDRIEATALSAMSPDGNGGGITITPIAAVSTHPTRVETYFRELNLSFSAVVRQGGQSLGGGVANPFNFFDPFSGLGSSWAPSPFDYSWSLPLLNDNRGFGSYSAPIPVPTASPIVFTQHLTGDPVSMVSGNLHHTEKDLQIPGDGPDFVLTRAYNSRSDEAGSLGHGWSHTYEARVEPVRDKNEFVYLPSSTTGFQSQDLIEGVRSDTLETSNLATWGATVRWEMLPVAFRNHAQIDSIDLELASKDSFTISVTQPAGVQNPGAVSHAASQLAVDQFRLKTLAGANFTDLSQGLTISLTDVQGTEEVHYARLRIRYRGPGVDPQPLVPSGLSYFDDPNLVTDADPSTCAATTSENDEAAISFTPSIPAGAFGYELLVSVSRESGGSGIPNAALWRGSVGSGEVFQLGPNANEGRQLRFVTVNATAPAFSIAFDGQDPTTGTRAVKLCHLEYRVLVMPQDQVDVVLADGSKLRFMRKPDGAWEPDPGIREQLTEDLLGFSLRQTDGSKLIFEHEVQGVHHLSRVSDAQGRSLVLGYDSVVPDRLLTVQEDNQITTSGGAVLTPTLTFQYDGSGFLDKITDWAANPRIWNYKVENGDLVEARDPVEVTANKPGTVYEYGYDPVTTENEDLVHNLTKIVYPKGGGAHSVEFEYFHSDRVASHTDSAGNRQSYLYNLPRLESEAIDARGFRTLYRYDQNGSLLQRVDPDGATWDWAYDPDRRVISETDALGFVTQFQDFNANGNPGKIIDAADPGRPTLYLYDDFSGAPRQVTDKRGNVFTTTFVYGLLTERRGPVEGVDTLLEQRFYDPAALRRLDRVVRRIEPEQGSDRTAVTLFFYRPGDRDVERVEHWEDADGDGFGGGPSDKLLSAKDILYDRLGRVTEERIARIDDPEGATQTTLVTGYAYSRRDEITRITRPDGTAIVSKYDDNGNLEFRYLEETLPKPGPGGAPVLVQHQRVDFDYNEIDRLEFTTDARGKETHFAYDATGNRTSTTNPLGNTTRVEYDPMNRPARTIDPTGAVWRVEYDLVGRVVREIDPTGLAKTRVYDPIGRVKEFQVGDAQAATVTRIYGPGNIYKEQLLDPEQRLTVIEFDELGRRKFVLTEDGESRLGYDLLGNLTSFEDPTGAASTFRFDALGREEEATPAWATEARATRYDETGNPLRITKATGCRLEMSYDEMGRLASRASVSDASSPCVGSVNDRFGYDARGNLVAAANEHVGLLREYDALDRLVSETDNRFGTAVRYIYDDASRLRGKVYPGGGVVHISYDALGRPIGIKDPFGDTTRYVYDAAGRRTETRSSSSLLATRLSYDARGQLEEIASTRSNGSPGVTTSYPDHDDVGNRKRKIDAQGTTDYSYDGLHRLETVTPPVGGAVHYDYDGAGNRIKSGAKAGGVFVAPFRDYTYSPQAAHWLTTVTDSGAGELEAFSGYNANGNPSFWVHEGAVRQLRWDALDRLIAIEGSFNATYVYDPLGRRIAKTELAATTRYQYDGLDVVAEYGTTSELQVRYVFGPGIDEPLKAKRGETVAAYHSDGLGSVRLLSQVGGAAGDLASYSYDAFGEDQGSAEAFANAYTFTGRERDASGLLYYRARYYLPRAGRFLTPDPLGLAGGSNPYAYAASNPVNFTDPFGLTPLSAKASYGNATSPVSFPAFSGSSVSVGGAPLSQGAQLAYAGAGTAAGGAVGAGLAYGAAALVTAAPVFAPVLAGAAVLGVGYAAYELTLGGGWNSLAGSAQALWNGTATAQQAFGLGFGVGSLAGGFGGGAYASSAARAGAESAAQGARLGQHLRQLEKYGQAGSRELSSGRIRYYGELDAATKPGEMAGRRLVREWDPATSATRTWHETLDASGTVRIVRPETGGPKAHYLFDEAGNYVGTR